MVHAHATHLKQQFSNTGKHKSHRLGTINTIYKCTNKLRAATQNNITTVSGMLLQIMTHSRHFHLGKVPYPNAASPAAHSHPSPNLRSKQASSLGGNGFKINCKLFQLRNDEVKTQGFTPIEPKTMQLDRHFIFKYLPVAMMMMMMMITINQNQ